MGRKKRQNHNPDRSPNNTSPDTQQGDRVAHSLATLKNTIAHEADANRKQSEGENRGRRFREIATLGFVIVTTAGVFVQAYILNKSDHAFQVSAKATKDAAEATRDSVKLSEKTAERQLRAYMTPMGGALTEFDPSHPERQFFAIIIFKNSGQTPAYGFTSRGSAMFAAFPLTDVLPVEDRQSGPGVIGPGNEYHVRVGIKDLTEERWNAVKSGDYAIYISGIYSYRDAFDKERTGEFRFYYGGKDGLTKNYSLTFHQKGNNAN